MPSAYFTQSSPVSNTSNSDYSPQTTSVTYPQARLASNGNRPIKIVRVRMNIAGYTSSRTVRIEMTGGYNGSTGNFTVAAGSSAANTGFKTIDVGVPTTPSSRVVSLYVSGRTYIGTDNSSGNTFRSSTGGTLFADRGLWGEYQYVQVPGTPSTPSISANSANSSVTVSWSGVSDWGDSSSGLGYRVFLYKDGVLNTTADVASTSTSNTFSSLTAGSNYSARVSAYNELKDFSGEPMSSQSASSTSVFLASPIPKYTVSYNSNGGSVNPSSQIVDKDSTVILPSPGTNTGTTFDGWVSSFNGQYYAAGATSHPITGDTTFTASWTQLTWTVSFDGNGGTTPLSETVNRGSSLPNGLPSSSRSGYTFTGWWTARSGGSFIGNAGSPYTPTDSLTLFAQWQPLAPGFTDEIVTANVPINVNVNTLSDNRVVATNAIQYSLVSGTGTFPVWLSINNSGYLSGSTNTAGTYNFRVRATAESGQSTDSNIITINVVYPGDRMTGPSTSTNISYARRHSNGQWIPITIARRWTGSKWEELSN